MRALPALLILYSFVLATTSPGQSIVPIEAATLPLPADLRSEAAILSVSEDGSFRTLRVGSNGISCLADRPGDDRFSVSCFPEALRDYLELTYRLPDDADRSVRDSLLTAALRAGEVIVPPGTLSRNISGSLNPAKGVPDSVRVWSEVNLPFADPETTGLPTDNRGADPWLMNAHRPGAHVMIGYRKVAWTEVATMAEER